MVYMQVNCCVMVIIIIYEMIGSVTVSDMCPLTILNTCHLLEKTRIAFCYHLRTVFCTCLLFL